MVIAKLEIEEIQSVKGGIEYIKESDFKRRRLGSTGLD